MMLVKSAQAGTLESADILINMTPAASGTGIQITLVSPTVKQYGAHMRKLIADTIIALGVHDAVIHANDKGALDYTIAARVKTAVLRASSQGG